MMNKKSRAIVLLALFALAGCEKKLIAEGAKTAPPVRTYAVVARIDKKGTNSASEGTALLKGTYDEGTKVLVYSLEYHDVVPQLITLRSGAKGSSGLFIKEVYSKDKVPDGRDIAGSFSLTPLQERSLLKGQWFVAVNTLLMSPEISGYLTLKQQ
ncbi:hypothetical protein [Pedobacter faecalis]|uniref:hypothetical protein n=1 Tax=Pedobacter faecalis TaxID=3041495 RepID=UPI00255059AF|nr:hypothetical protein [Pedobacter sp. ELA7]